MAGRTAGAAADGGEPMSWALFRNGKQIGPICLQWRVALDEALDRGLVKKASDRNFVLDPWCEIRKLDDKPVGRLDQARKEG